MRREEGLIQLFDPPFDTSDLEPGDKVQTRNYQTVYHITLSRDPKATDSSTSSTIFRT